MRRLLLYPRIVWWQRPRAHRHYDDRNKLSQFLWMSAPKKARKIMFFLSEVGHFAGHEWSNDIMNKSAIHPLVRTNFPGFYFLLSALTMFDKTSVQEIDWHVGFMWKHSSLYTLRSIKQGQRPSIVLILEHKKWKEPCLVLFQNVR